MIGHRLRIRGAVLLALLALPVGAAGVARAQSGSVSYFTGQGIGAMTAGRQDPVAAPLPGGDVLIAGGTETGGPLSSAEVFDPVTGVFTATAGSMTTPRYSAVAAPLPDGDVLIAGGANQSSPWLASAEVFDPSTGDFTATPESMTTPRVNASAAPLPNGDVLIAGGTSTSGTLSSAEVFDPSTGTFTAISGSMTTPRNAAVAAPLPDGDVLIAGGINGPNPVASAEVFDPSTGDFTATPDSMNTPRQNAVAAPLPDGDVLIAGGSDGTNALASAEEFDPSTGTFTATSGAMTNPLYDAAAAPLPDGDVLIAGGQDPTTGVLASAEVFVPAADASLVGEDFGDQTVGEPSGAAGLTVTNVGAQPLSIAGASLSGADPADFSILSDGCAGARLALSQQCTITVRFTASITATESAALTLADNELSPASVPLSGMGVEPESGPTGATGPTGLTGATGGQGATGPPGAHGPSGATGAAGASGAIGPTGVVGPRGPAGNVELMKCTVSADGARRCRTSMLASPVSLPAGVLRAELTRGVRVYASGRMRDGRLILETRRAVRAGRYVLVLSGRVRRRAFSARERVSVP